MINIQGIASSSSGNLFFVENEDTLIMLECGLNKKDLQKAMSDYGKLIIDFNACITTHFHADHIQSIEYVLDYIDVYSTEQTNEKHPRAKILAHRTPISIGSIKVLPIEVSHGETLNNAFILKDRDSVVFFGTDFNLMTSNLSKIPFDKIFIECNYDDNEVQQVLDSVEDEKRIKYIRQISTHMGKENCKIHLRHMDLSKCQEITLLHRSKFLTNRNIIIEEMEQEFKIPFKFIE